MDEVDVLEKEIYDNATKLENEYETEELFLKYQFEEFLSAFWALFSNYYLFNYFLTY